MLIPGFMTLPGGTEWFIVLVVVLLIFGPKNLPKLGKAMGGFVTSFKAGQQGEEMEDEEEEEEAEDFEEVTVKSKTAAKH